MSRKAEVGTVLPPADATLTGFAAMPKHDEARILEVYKGATEAVLQATGKDYVRSTKAVLAVIGTPDLVPPNFKEMLDSPMVIGGLGAMFGEVDGMVVKHFVGSTWGPANRGGGVYFFTAPEHIDAYLSSADWDAMSKDTPWSGVTYAKYVLG